MGHTAQGKPPRKTASVPSSKPAGRAPAAPKVRPAFTTAPEVRVTPLTAQPINTPSFAPRGRVPSGGWLAPVGLASAAGGGLYAYSRYRSNKKRKGR